jgi:chorismate-pyruvate lyase
MEYPDLMETKKLISEIYSTTSKQINMDIPDIYVVKELIQNTYKELEQEKLEQDKLEQDKLEQDKLEQEKLEQDKLEQEKLEQENSELGKSDGINDDTVHIKEDAEIAVHIKNIFDASVLNSSESDNNEIEMVQLNGKVSLGETLTVDDLIVKTIGEYEILKEYRVNMCHKNEKIMNLPKSVLIDDLKQERPVQQILVPITTKPVLATKKHCHHKTKSTKSTK